jgi:hypothetical protein
MKAEFLIRTLSKAIPPFHEKAFPRNLNHAIQVAAAKGRADSLVAAAGRLRFSICDGNQADAPCCFTCGTALIVRLIVGGWCALCADA